MLARSRNSCAESYRLPYRITCLFIRLRCTCISSKLGLAYWKRYINHLEDEVWNLVSCTSPLFA